MTTATNTIMNLFTVATYSPFELFYGRSWQCPPDTKPSYAKKIQSSSKACVEAKRSHSRLAVQLALEGFDHHIGAPAQYPTRGDRLGERCRIGDGKVILELILVFAQRESF